MKAPVLAGLLLASFAVFAGEEKSYWLPAAEIAGFDLLLNQFNRRVWPNTSYETSWSSVKRNLRSRWVTENDPFDINQLGHPYQGSMYQGFARSAGLTYWESLGYTFAGSAFWEIAGETTPPSKNDQVASGIGGSFLGEALFRMASLVLENRAGTPALWRELTAASLSPAAAFNRFAYGQRFAPFASRGAVYYSRLSVGASAATQARPRSAGDVHRGELLADFAIDYGLPGKPGYEYTRPFDYFRFEATASSVSGFENLSTRGLLIGRPYAAGLRYRGIWGLYGGYDYLSPQLFRVSSTALSLGTTAQLWLTSDVALQGTATAGLGYAAVGTLRGSGERDYHYGVAPQALISTRLIFGNRASLDLTARDFFVTRVSNADRAGHDNIVRADVALTVRVHGPHALSLRYLLSHRDARYPDLGDRSQKIATIGLYYTFLGQDRFGAVQW